MKIKVVVVVYNRYDNIKRWIDVWQKCQTDNSELIIIHNDNGESEKYKELCVKNNIQYIKRENIGFDIGVFQEICKESLKEFDNNWDYLLFSGDDTIPMSKDFIQKFVEKAVIKDVGVTCLEISKEVKLHIRTTGFMISKEMSKKLEFPVDKITTKNHCYLFEHRSPNAFYEQIIKNKKKVLQVDNFIIKSCMWNFGNRVNLNRWNEFFSTFQLHKNQPKITFIATIYNTFPEIVSSLINQTYRNWELLLIHDGKTTTNLSKILDTIKDDRIKFIETEERKNLYGHPIRKWALENIDELSPNSDYVVVTNSDNHYVPIFIDEMIKGFNKIGTIATYCSSFVHGYKSQQPDGIYNFGVLQTKLQLGWVDCGGVMIKKEVAKETIWEDMSHSSDWTWFNKILTKYGHKSWNKVLGCLFVHN